MLRLLSLVVLLNVVVANPTHSDVMAQYFKLSSPRREMVSNAMVQTEVELQKMCERYGGDGAFENLMITIQNSAMEMRSYMTEETERAATYGDSNMIAVNCRITPYLKKILPKVMNEAKNCISPENRDVIAEVVNITNSLMDYTCYNGGQRIISFMENDGPQCMAMSQEGLVDCFQKSFGNLFDKGVLQEASNKEKECRSVFQFKPCVTSLFGKCPNPASSTFITGLFDTITMPSCNKYMV